MLLGGVPGVAAAKVVIIGGGVSGTNAARMAMGMEAHVTVIDRSLEQLYALDEGQRAKLRLAGKGAIAAALDARLAAAVRNQTLDPRLGATRKNISPHHVSSPRSVNQPME